MGTRSISYRKFLRGPLAGENTLCMVHWILTFPNTLNAHAALGHLYINFSGPVESIIYICVCVCTQMFSQFTYGLGTVTHRALQFIKTLHLFIGPRTMNFREAATPLDQLADVGVLGKFPWKHIHKLCLPLVWFIYDYGRINTWMLLRLLLAVTRWSSIKGGDTARPR